MRHTLPAASGLFALLCLPAPAAAQEDADARFELGQIVVSAEATGGASIASETLDKEAIEAFNRNSLDDALQLLPGVVAANSGGSRNERLVFVRGFDRFQVPLSIDGIRVYLPADNRLDFGRFLTPDIAEIQVAKGYASVLDGPGAMGGAINLVTRKPTRKWAAEFRGVLDLDRDGGYAGYTGFALLGTRHESWYAQASFARSFRDHWDLPGDFQPALNEDGGARDFSRTEDWRLNLKAGFTPNARDEYSISYTRQEGSKLAPLHISSSNNRVLRNWTWPEWNIESLYFLSTTALGDSATLKTQAFKSNYYNMLRAYDDRTLSSQTMGRAFDSPYDDMAAGGSLQLELGLGARNVLSLAAHFRRDEHEESQTSHPDIPGSMPEPVQQSLEKSWSAAVEDRYAISGALSATLSFSYDWRTLEKAQEYDEDLPQPLFEFPLKDAEGWNAQGRVDWKGGNRRSAYAALSSRIRFPTLFERFSSQFGTAEPNPGLDPERATNLEIGGATRLGQVRLSGAAYYSWLSDALVTIRTAENLNRRENIGSADYYGFELSLELPLTGDLDAGFNYSYIHRSFDLGKAPIGGFIREFRLTDVPAHSGITWIDWTPVAGLDIRPALEFASDRPTVDAATANGDAPVYFELDGYVTASLRADYAFGGGLSLGLGARNLFDANYLLTDGFPEPGRSFFIVARARY